MLADGSDQLTDACLQALLLLVHHSPGTRPRVTVEQPPASLHHDPPPSANPSAETAVAAATVAAATPAAGVSTGAAEAGAAPGSAKAGDEHVRVAASHTSEPAALLRATSGETLTADAVGVHRAMLASIRHEKDLSLMARRIAALLNAVWQNDAAYFPGSTSSPVLCQQELVALLYYLLCDNPSFLTHVVRDSDANALVVPLCYFLWAGRLTPARSQFLHLCTFTLFLLSGYRDFAVGLNTKVAVALPGGVPTVAGESTHADLLVLTLHRLVVNATRRLRPLYGHFLAVSGSRSCLGRL